MADHRLTRRELHIGWLLALLVVAVVALLVAVWWLVATVTDLASGLPVG